MYKNINVNVRSYIENQFYGKKNIIEWKKTMGLSNRIFNVKNQGDYY